MGRQTSYTLPVPSKKSKQVGPDSTLSWVVAAACFLVSVIVGGLNRANGILFTRYVEQSGLDRELASWPFNVFGAAVFAAPLTGVLATWLSARMIFVLGILMYGCGIALCYISIDVYFMIVFFGIIRGIGVTLVVTLMPVFISSYFVKHLSTAQGIASAGGAFGTMVFSYLIEFFLDEYSLRGSMLLIGGVAMHGMIGAMLMQKPPWTKSVKTRSTFAIREEKPVYSIPERVSSSSSTQEIDKKNDSEKENSGQDENVFQRFFAVVLDPMYIVLTLSYIFSVNFSMIYVLVITDYANDINMSDGILFLMVYSIGELFGRLGLGWITDRKLIGRRTYLVCSYVITGLVGGAMPFSRIPAVHLVSAAILGISQGSNLAISMAVLADEVTKDRLQLSVSLLRSCNGLGALARSPLIGFFRDGLGSYDHLFHTLAGLTLLGALLWIILIFSSFMKRRHYPAV